MKAAMLIHGFATCREDYARLVPILSTRYDEIWCADLPGHGEGTERANICAEDILRAVTEAFDALAARCDTIDLIGFSMGGALASMLASTRKINRLILLAPANKFLAPTFVANTIGTFLLSGKKEREIKQGKAKNQDTLTLKELAADVGEGVKLFRQLIKRYTPKNLKEFNKVIKTCNERLSAITVPTLIVWGKMDQLVPYTSVRHLLKYCDERVTRVVVYADVSHLMFYSRAHFRITDDILKFLQVTDCPLLAAPHSSCQKQPVDSDPHFEDSERALGKESGHR